MKRFLRIYAEALAILLAFVVPIVGALAPIFLWLAYDNKLWLLLYILIIPLIVAVLDWMERMG